MNHSFYRVGILFLIISSFLTGQSQARAEKLISALDLKSPVYLCLESVPIETAQVKERFEKEMLLSLGNAPQLILWQKRSTRYFPFIEQQLEKSDLPLDIKYLAVAESALRVHAGSRKGALGVWQLMAQTARKYGLTVNERVDERRNVYLSTKAAIRYLSDLYNQFGAWSLALAAYNMGEEGLEAEILEQGIANYYQLYLPLETQRFVFRILAIKMLIESPEKYDIQLPADNYYPPLQFSSVQITAKSELPIRLIAQAANCDFKRIKDLNPELRGHYLFAGTRMVNIPREGKYHFQGRLAHLIEKDSQQRNQKIYIVKKDDNLSTIARRFDVPLTALLIWNRIGINTVIHPGQRLVVFASSGQMGIDAKQSDGETEQ